MQVSTKIYLCVGRKLICKKNEQITMSSFWGMEGG